MAPGPRAPGMHIQRRGHAPSSRRCYENNHTLKGEFLRFSTYALLSTIKILNIFVLVFLKGDVGISSQGFKNAAAQCKSELEIPFFFLFLTTGITLEYYFKCLLTGRRDSQCFDSMSVKRKEKIHYGSM